MTAIFLPLVYGSRFSGAIGYGMVLLPGVAMFGIASVLAATINGRGHPEYSLRTALISTPPSLVLYAVLIPLFEGWGAAIASTASYGLNLAVTAVYYRRATGDRVLPLLVPTRYELADLRDLFVRPPPAAGRESWGCVPCRPCAKPEGRPAPAHVGLNLVFLVPGETGGMEVFARELLPRLRGRCRSPRR